MTINASSPNPTRSWLQFWSRRPSRKTWAALPLLYMLFLQFLTGLPKPEGLREFDAHELLLRFSEEIFDYPFWLQDLSHLPLFLVLAWLWSWFLGPIDRLSSTLSNRAFQLSLGYEIFNEMIQAFIPQRFPSLVDVAMNALGVLLGLYLHSLLCRTQKGSGKPSARKT